MSIRIKLLSACLFFVLLSFIPTFYEYFSRNKIPPERYFVLEHNYNFDYNFYLSRIRQGIEGKRLVTEKYYNKPHNASLFQAVYLYLGKIGGLAGLTPTAIYQLSRFIFGFLLLWTIILFGKLFFKDRNKLLLFFLLTVTAGSWPVLVRAGGFPRFATYMGWWSVIDSLQRITIMPHILIGQMLMVLLITKLADVSRMTYKSAMIYGILGLSGGIIFPPMLIILFTYLFVLTSFTGLDILSLRITFAEKIKKIREFIRSGAGKIIIFAAISLPSLIYLQLGLREQPWKALGLFDIEHRFIMPYKDYALSLGPVLILGVLGLIRVFFKGEKDYQPAVIWLLSIGLLFVIFENVPQQSPLRFTEGLVHVPLAVLATNFLYGGVKNRIIRRFISGGVIITGFLVMVSMVLWLTDQAYAKRLGTWSVPLGAQLAYPQREFMEGIFYLRDNTREEDVVLGYITAGNYIPAYAGNYVFLGHANTPDEDEKEVIAASFFKSVTGAEEARKWLQEERIKYVFSGPQERELGGIADLREKYNFLTEVYSNNQVVIYKII